MNKYKINFTTQFIRKYRKITNNNVDLQDISSQKINILRLDPFQITLKTHKYKNMFSSRISGDIRIIWNFTSPSEITLFNIGGHEGKLRVYK
jgi:mRNA-degrading endonuclease YafQ of YafQ-DinJ toxin-antitoxin module